MDTKNNDKEYWNKLAWAYNNMFQNRKIYKKLYNLINESLNKDMDVLEIGTGSGMIARKISDGGRTVPSSTSNIAYPFYSL